MTNTRPPLVLIKTWLDIYYSQQTRQHYQAQCVVESRILENFYSVYEAEMYLFKCEQKEPH